jgi:SNF2 family DNA or RNA helicase
MFVLHSHWCPPRRSSDAGGILFWAETSDSEPLTYLRGRLPKKQPPKDHPFLIAPDLMRESLGAGTPLGSAEDRLVKLRLPASRTGPLPSPELAHNWNLDSDTPPFLAPWLIDGLWLTSSKAFGVLVSLPEVGPDNSFMLGQDTRYWRHAANLVLEVIATQRFVPVLFPIKNNGAGNGHYHARWQPVLDSGRDGERVAQLADAMPSICRLEAMHPNGRYHMEVEHLPRNMLNTFLNTMCDSLVRSWGRSGAPLFREEDNEPYHAWVKALFQDDATVDASNAQLQALNSGLRAWMRNLQAAGDATFRIAFQLEAPESESESPAGDGEWKINYLLQGRDDPTLLVPSDQVWHSNGAALTVGGQRFENPQEKLLGALGYAARLFPPLLPSLQTAQPTGTTFDTQTAYAFLREAGPLLEQAGFGLLAPPWWNQRSARLGMRLRLRSREAAGPTGPIKMGLDNLVEYQWELALGDTVLTREEFNALAAMKTPLVQIRGQWVQLDAEQIEAAIRFWEKKKHSGTMSLMEAARYNLSGETAEGELPLSDVVAEDWIGEWLDNLSESDRVSQLAQPSGMTGYLRPYQRRGFSWMAFFRRWGLGACLADDMGLGKTIQTLALLVYEKEYQGELPGPVLLICPTSVVTNWQREAQRFAPGLTTLVHQGSGRLRNSEFTKKSGDYDLVLTSYAVARQDADLLRAVSWYGVIVDEAQNIKNPAAKQTQIISSLPSTFRFALTGTPVENRLLELYSIFNFIIPGYLGKRDTFRREFAIPIERFGDKDATRQLRNLVSPFILRRLKTDPTIIQDLPDKIETKDYCHLTEEQASLYQAVVNDTMAEVEASEGIQRHGLVLRLLTQLKQVCNHPLQYQHQIEAALADRSQVRNRSGKLTRLEELLDEIVSSGDRVLLFTQYAEMGKLLSAYLPPTMGTSVQFLYGGTPARQRDQMVRRFQEDENGPSIFILSLKAGGTGLNLTRATHVIHFDRWWNPAVEDQATDRAFRIGQHKNVQVRKFITVGTLEERIDEMIEAKKELAEAVIGGGEQWMTDLSTDELRQMVALRR